MSFYWLLIIFSLVNHIHSYNYGSSNIKCSQLLSFSEELEKKFEETSHKNYLSGNVAWGRSKLTNYKDSELRLIEIIDQACDSVPKPARCYSLAEEFEADIVEWYKSEKEDNVTLYQDLFVEKKKLCCPENHYGPNCDPCKSLKGKEVCSNNGSCEGSLTREGSGSCKCYNGHIGDDCSECEVKFFKADGSCRKCYPGCLLGCTEFSSKHCIKNLCAEDFYYDEEHGCALNDDASNRIANENKRFGRRPNDDDDEVDDAEETANTKEVEETIEPENVTQEEPKEAQEEL